MEAQMSTVQTYAHPAGRILLALIFIISGLGKLGDVAGVAGYMASVGLPAILAWPAILFEIVAGIALLIGCQTRITALALAGFSLLTAVIFHLDPADPTQMITFLRNLAMAGGYLLLFANGAGALSLDNRLHPATT
jgi:putative oxidoreductase